MEGLVRKMKAKLVRTVIFLLGVVLSGVFVRAGLSKIPDPGSFRKTLEGFQLLPAALVMPFSLWIPWLELSLGVFYWVRGFRLASLYGTMLLLAMFCAALSYASIRGIEMDCGCFGASAGATSAHHGLLRNAFLMTAGCLLIFREMRERSRTAAFIENP